MKNNTFKLSHSVLATAVLLLVEAALFYFGAPKSIQEVVVLGVAAIGAVINIYVATEVIEEVKGRTHMFVILTIVMIQFILFFAFEYFFLYLVQPASFPNLTADPVTFVLHSVMVFVFNPLYLPATAAGRSLLLVNTFGALGLALFVLQNISQFRAKSLDKVK
jgi:hypothetical protein